MTSTDNITQVLLAADGEIVGRIRFQKIFYLLEQLGMQSDTKFSYHHYGPYSEEVSIAIEHASLPNGAVEEKKISAFDNYYSVYKLIHQQSAPSSLGRLEWGKACNYVQAMKAESSMVLELAATIHWLKKKENVGDWKSELKNRKGIKAEETRIAKAIDLLCKLGIDDCRTIAHAS